MLEVYDQIIGDYLNLNKEKNLLISTGLSKYLSKNTILLPFKNHFLYEKYWNKIF